MVAFEPNLGGFIGGSLMGKSKLKASSQIIVRLVVRGVTLVLGPFWKRLAPIWLMPLVLLVGLHFSIWTFLPSGYSPWLIRATHPYYWVFFFSQIVCEHAGA